MSKRGYISRYMIIIKRLKAIPFSSFDDILFYMSRQFEQLNLQDDTLIMGFSLRTFQRDIKEIRTLFGIEILFDKSKKGYFIQSSSYDSTGFERMMEAFDIFNSLHLTQNLSSFVSLESRETAGTENL